MSNKSPINTFHVIGKSDLTKWPCDNQQMAWEIFCKVIHELQENHELKTRSFVLMSNHYHWLCQYHDQENPLFFEDYHQSINLHFQNYVLSPKPQVVHLTSKAAYTNTYKYIYRNPVTAGITFKAEDYSYSTLGNVLGRSKKLFQIEDNMNLITDPYRIINWINAPWGEQLYSQYYSEGPQPLEQYLEVQNYL